MRKTLSTEYRELIGGEHSIPFIGYALFIPSTTLSSILANWKFVEAGHIGEVVFANILSIIAVIGVYCLFKETVYRNRAIKPVSPWLVALFGISIGFTKGFITSYSLFYWGLHRTAQEALIPNALVTALLGLIMVPGIGVISSFLHRFREERAHLLLEIINRDARLANQPVSPAPEVLAQLNQFISRSQKTLELSDGSTAEDVASQIRKLNFDVLRPVSHQIWQVENKKIADYSFRDLHKFMLREYLFKTRYIGIIYGLGSLGFSIQHLGVAAGISYSVLASIILTLIFKVAGMFPTKTTATDLIRLGLSISATIILQTAALPIFHNHAFNQHSLSGVLLNIFWLLTVLYIVGLCMAAFRTHDEIQAKLQVYLGTSISTLKNSSAMSQIANREFANYLHSDVQNYLLRTALDFESASPNQQVVAAKLANLRDYLSKIEDSYYKQPISDLSGEILALSESWHGIVSVDISIQKTAKSELTHVHHPADKSMVSALNEAIANAARHGFADQVKINVSSVKKRFVITCEDNGTGPKVRVRSGLGSRLFSEITRGDWNLSSTSEGGAKLQLNIPY